MKQIKKIVMGLACLLAAGTANAQWVVSDPGNLAQGIIRPLQRRRIRWTDSRKRQRSLNKVRFTMMR